MLLCLMNCLAKVQKKKTNWFTCLLLGQGKVFVIIHYYNSEFLGKASAQDLYQKFISCLAEIEPNKLLQVLSDRANVNLAFLDILNRFREDNEQPHLVNIGKCRLYTLYNAFENG